MFSSLASILALQLVTVTPPSTSTTLVVVGYDATRSLTGDAFGRFPDWNRDVVLPLLRAGDMVLLKFVDHAPRKGPPIRCPCCSTPA